MRKSRILRELREGKGQTRGFESMKNSLAEGWQTQAIVLNAQGIGNYGALDYKAGEMLPYSYTDFALNQT